MRKTKSEVIILDFLSL